MFCCLTWFDSGGMIKQVRTSCAAWIICFTMRLRVVSSLKLLIQKMGHACMISSDLCDFMEWWNTNGARYNYENAIYFSNYFIWSEPGENLWTELPFLCILSENGCFHYDTLITLLGFNYITWVVLSVKVLSSFGITPHSIGLLCVWWC